MRRRFPFGPTTGRRLKVSGFTLIELAVAAAVFALILVMLLSFTDILSRTWKGTTDKKESFEAARWAFDRMTANISQAVLNTYWDYDSVSNPTLYERRSELQFLTLPTVQLNGLQSAVYPTHAIFFQAPTGAVGDQSAYGNLPMLLNAFGYFIEYSDDSAELPAFIPRAISPSRFRFRLKEWKAPSEKLNIYAYTSSQGGKAYLGPASYAWIDLKNPVARTLAENVIALIINPRNPEAVSADATALTSNFVYNSRNNGSSLLEKSQRHQLPPEVDIIMVAVAESSALRIFGNSSAAPALTSDLFTDPSKLESDLQKLTKSLDDAGIRYIVLRSNVKIRGARWSQD